MNASPVPWAAWNQKFNFKIFMEFKWVLIDDVMKRKDMTEALLLETCMVMAKIVWGLPLFWKIRGGGNIKFQLCIILWQDCQNQPLNLAFITHFLLNLNKFLQSKFIGGPFLQISKGFAAFPPRVHVRILEKGDWVVSVVQNITDTSFRTSPGWARPRCCSSSGPW